MRLQIFKSGMFFREEEARESLAGRAGYFGSHSPRPFFLRRFDGSCSTNETHLVAVASDPASKANNKMTAARNPSDDDGDGLSAWWFVWPAAAALVGHVVVLVSERSQEACIGEER